MEVIKNRTLLEKKIREYQLNEFFQNDHSAHMKLVSLEKGEKLYIQDEESHFICFFLKGKIKVYRTLSNGKENIINVIDKCQLLGEVELMTNKGALTSIAVLEASECILISSNYCREYLLYDVTFLQKIACHMAQTMYSIDVNLSINLFLPLENRVASYILSSENQGYFTCELRTLPERLGTTYRHLLRVLKQLQENDVIKKEASRYRIVQRTYLEERGSEYYSL